jgi:hypothetical protein
MDMTLKTKPQIRAPSLALNGQTRTPIQTEIARKAAAVQAGKKQEPKDTP